ncbi:hypothetical protein INH39_03435 [Massilia violaceinigra]|uniref:Uncharacterized protein n=1 Tax=Massilia violaceinigra TaxID=2045208 RepID=A0ABY4AE10_9BURK|nr:hypothetical protein [Massilia violaceinigra]UOD30803.1 hypothetical protein INH39_03435 [Massilia violaceinigra]
MKYLVMMGLLATGPACAGGFEDMKTALALLQGQGTLRAAYEARETHTEFDAKPLKGPETAMVVAQVEDDPGGLEIRWDRGLLKRAADESSVAKGARRKQALSQLVGSSSAPRLAVAMNYAPRLLQSLSIAQFKSERADSYQGKPARLVELVMAPQEEVNQNVSIKENTIEARFWLGPDGVPLGAVTTHTVKAKLMVFMSYEKTTKEEFTFGVVNNRLVVLKREMQGKEKGPGTENEFKNLYTVTPKL